ncbi:MAG: MauE/DoxX family redox-associated membrane protein [Planctomycetia bacterium]
MSPDLRRRLLLRLCDLLPALFLLLSGGAKLAFPGGTQPRALADWLDASTYASALRALGALELLLGAGLLARRTRAGARATALLLVAGFTAFLAWNAADSAFLGDCGCLGALKLPETAASLLARNALLLGLLAAGALAAARPAWTLGQVARQATLLGLLAFALAWGLAGMQRAEGLARKAQRLAQGRAHAERVGWKLPEVAVRRADGTRSTLAAVVQPHDTLLFFSTRCAHCEREAPAWAEEAAALAAAGGRLLLVAASEAGGPARDFLARHGAAGVAHAVLVDPADLAQVGADSVPLRILLDGEARVAAHLVHGGSGSLLEALATAAEAWPGARESLWAALAQQAFGPGAQPAGPEQPLLRGARRPVAAAGGQPAGWLVVLASPRPAAEALEVAYALVGGRIAWARLLVAAPLLGPVERLRPVLARAVGQEPAAWHVALEASMRGSSEPLPLLWGLDEHALRLAGDAAPPAR